MFTAFQAALPLALAAADWHQLRAVLTTSRLAKGQALLQPGQVCDSIYFVVQGVLRHYRPADGADINTQFALAGSFTTDFVSLTSQQPSTLTIAALPATEVVRLRRADMLALYQETPALQAVGQCLLEQLLAAQQQRLEAFTHDSAAARYRLLCAQQPALLQAVPLYHLASYLGLSRETLSRVRRGRASRAL